MSATICLLAILPGLGLYIQGGRGKASYKSDFFPNITTIWSLHGALRTIFVAYNFPFRNIRTQSSFISEMSCTKNADIQMQLFFCRFWTSCDVAIFRITALISKPSICSWKNWQAFKEAMPPWTLQAVLDVPKKSKEVSWSQMVRKYQNYSVRYAGMLQQRCTGKLSDFFEWHCQ